MKNILLVIACMFFVFRSFSQTRSELEESKKKSYEKIEYVNKLIEKNKRTKQQNYNTLVLLNKKIDVRNEIIGDYIQEIEIINKRIRDNQDLVISLYDDLEKIKEEYKKVIVNSYKNRRKYDRLMFILSAKDFNQAYRRARYLREYTEYRKQQAELIIDTKNRIEKTLTQLEIEKAEKNELIFDKESENETLKGEISQKQSLINKLKSKEKELRAKIENERRVAKKIQNQIEEIIAEEARKAATRSGSSKVMMLTPDEKIISDEFGSNRKRLPWPTERGIVTQRFGDNPHPVLKGVIIRNDGVEIATTPDATARAVFKGEVSRVFAIPGANKAVIIRHGNYLTVYSNLKDVIVKPGEKINTKQNIGVIYTDRSEDDKTVIKFQIWRENKKLNPEDWIVKGG
jgi:murein hydrolase activator